jgi:hypothetical protein
LGCAGGDSCSFLVVTMLQQQLVVRVQGKTNFARKLAPTSSKC